jgi:CRP/FNR family transcriptional regulator
LTADKKALAQLPARNVRRRTDADFAPAQEWGFDTFHGVQRMLQSTATSARPSAPRVGAPTRTDSRDPRELDNDATPDNAALDEMAHARRRVRRGELLYRAGDPFHALFAIRCGFFTSRVVLENGRDQVTGYHMAGDMVGLDDIATGTYTSDVAALEDGEVYAIAASHLDEPGMLRRLAAAMSQAMARHRDMQLLLGSMRATERLAAFLLDLSRRMDAGGMSPREFHLRMTRAEIASYLGLSLETVSRQFSRFHADRLIAVRQRHVRLLDIAGLKAVSE